MDRLPIDAALGEIALALAAPPRAAVVIALPGAGKTTRIAPFLREDRARSGQILLLEPRRIAAIAAAARIAEERGWTLGREVGYEVRFERRVSDSTRLRVMTDGVLLRRLQRDPFLEDVSTVILDEFHERSLELDLVIALLQDVRGGARDDLEVLVLSATMEPAPVAVFLGGAPVIDVPGRLYPLEVRHVALGLRDPVEVAIASELEREWPRARGHALIFLPGIALIRRTAENVAAFARREGASIGILHGSSSLEEQKAVLERSSARRIILATNVAETSLTIDGVDLVIDSGLVRRLSSDLRHGIDRLETERVSQHSADQRAGRAGRTGPGTVVRLWSSAEHSRLDIDTPPAIRREDLTRAVLELWAWGVSDVAAFRWLEAPDPAAVERAVRLLLALGAAPEPGARLAPKGAALLELPAPPRLGALLFEAGARGVVRDAARVAALVEERDIIAFGSDASGLPGGARRASKSDAEDSDIVLRLELLAAVDSESLRADELRARGLDPGAVRAVRRTARDLEERARRIVPSAPEPAGSARESALAEAVLAAYPDRVARRRSPGSDRGLLVGGRGVILSRRSVVRDAELFVAVAVDDTHRGPRGEARVDIASPITRAAIERVFPGAIADATTLEFDDALGRPRAFVAATYRDLPLEERREVRPDRAAAEALLRREVGKRASELVATDTAATAWLTRARCLAKWCPDLELPELGDPWLATALEAGAAGRRSVAELKDAGLADLLRAAIGPAAAALIDRLAPEAIGVPSGSRIRLEYSESGPPVLAVRLQELFGLAETPRIAKGRIPVVLHILGPNYRPVQVTQDLSSFWNTTYDRVRKELRGRYPKHSWPEDPWTAPPTRGARRRRDGDR
jgi:ATP-dependent helicase HrpB